MAQNQKTKDTLTQGDIHDAVADLDQANPDHWTKAGDPNIDVIRAKFGMPVGSITRADVKAATTRVQSSPPPQAEKPAETPPAENGNGESPAETPPTKPAEKTAGQQADEMIANAKKNAAEIINKAKQEAGQIKTASTPAESTTEPEPAEPRVLVQAMSDLGGTLAINEPDLRHLPAGSLAWVNPKTAEALGENGSNALKLHAEPSDDQMEKALNPQDVEFVL